MSTFAWQTLGNSPVAGSRTDDIWFFDETHGWLVNSSGYVCETTDGGDCWQPRFYLCPGLPSRPYLRCMGWANEKIGWFGSVTGQNPPNAKDYLKTLLHHTSDGGKTWKAVEGLPDDSPLGVCGFYAVNDQVAYGSGTNDPSMGAPGIIKTTNGGKDWELIPMGGQDGGEHYADNLIDIFFTDENNGFVVGGKIEDSCPASNPAYLSAGLKPYVQLKPRVLRTSDGGKSWVNTTADIGDFQCGEWGWKIQFLEKENYKYGFVSLENFRDAAILRTEDGGNSWKRLHVAASQDPSAPAINQDLEGIGFIDEKHGWVGGWGQNFPNQGYLNSYTEDGGETWKPQNHVPGASLSDDRIRINRYRIKGDPGNGGFAYCSGIQVYRFNNLSVKKSAFATSKARREPARSDGLHAAVSMLPNESSSAFAKDYELTWEPKEDGTVAISYTLPENTPNVFLGLWNKFAFYVRKLIDETSPSGGRRTVIWDGKDDFGRELGKGPFICRMSTGDQNGASQMIELPAVPVPQQDTAAVPAMA